MAEFQQALLEHDDQTVLDRFYYSRPAIMLEGDREATLRRAVSNQFSVAMRDVIITGSAKLGFTVVPKEHRPTFSPFGDNSDIDVAIISSDLFTGLWRTSLEYATDHGDWPTANSFRKFLMRGWLRPDQLPKTAEYPKSREWFDFFRTLTSSGAFGPYKISAGVYYDEWFWEKYAALSFKNCRLAIEAPL
ncbi:MAG TPA: hypothetical protein VFH89_00440 [Sphingomicrobium sp.]|nr:hypothetical protein [Sphingomicrobium sp.]